MGGNCRFRKSIRPKYGLSVKLKHTEAYHYNVPQVFVQRELMIDPKALVYWCNSAGEICVKIIKQECEVKEEVTDVETRQNKIPQMEEKKKEAF